MTFDSSERSVQDSAPSELYEFFTPNNVWRYTSNREVTNYLGQSYTPAVIKRSAPGTTTTAEAPQFFISVPTSLDVVKKNAFNRMPPRSLYVYIYRGQSGIYIPYWDGYITAMSVEDRWVKMLCPGLMGSALATQIPTVGYHTNCTHQLYGTRCGKNKDVYGVTTKVASFTSQVEMTLNSTAGQPDQYFRAGMLTRTLDGESRMILDQRGNVITLDAPFPELNLLDEVIIYAGCNHTVFDCADKFDNIVNYGGTPYIPSLNMFRGQLRSLI